MGGGSPARGVAAFKVAVALHKVGLLITMYATGWLDIARLLAQAQSAAPLAIAATTSLLVAGLWLQGLVYQKIGANGVYYGFKMGIEVPWCHEFPFSFFRHPQYVSASTLFVALLLAIGWRDTSPVFLSFQMWLYSVTAQMEEIGDQEPAETKNAKKKR